MTQWQRSVAILPSTAASMCWAQPILLLRSVTRDDVAVVVGLDAEGKVPSAACGVMTLAEITSPLRHPLRKSLGPRQKIEA